MSEHPWDVSTTMRGFSIVPSHTMKKHEIPDNLPPPERDPDPVPLDFPEAVHHRTEYASALAPFSLMVAVATLIFTFSTGREFRIIGIVGTLIAFLFALIALRLSRKHRSHRPRFYSIVAIIVCVMIIAFLVYDSGIVTV
jgi:hypothetical protein